MPKTILACHFLQADMRSSNGREKPWTVGETRTYKDDLVLCERGYHYAPTWADALLGNYLYGPIACVVRVETDGPKDEHKGVSHTRELVKAVDVTKEMRLFAADEATRALRLVERRSGKKADPRSWAAVQAARDHVAGKISDDDLAAARAAAGAAAKAAGAATWAAAGAAWAAAGAAAKAAARAAAWAAAGDASARRFAARIGDAVGYWDEPMRRCR